MVHADLADRYDHAAPKWGDVVSKLGFFEAYVSLIRKANVGADQGARILDAGCGTGAMSQAFLTDRIASTDELTLLDNSSAMLRIASSKLRCFQAKLTPVHDTIGTDHLRNQSFELILCAHVIEHCEDPIAALSWLREHLSPDGKLILAVSKPHWCTALVRWKWRSAAWHPQQVRDMLLTAGFKKISIHPHENGPPSRVSCGYVAQ